MIEKQDKYFVEEMDNEYFMVWEYSGKTIDNSGVVFSSDVIYKDGVKIKEDIKKLDEIPEINLSVKKTEDLNLTDYVVMKEMPITEDSSNYKVLVSNKNILAMDKIAIAEFYDGPLTTKDYDFYKEEPIDLFFERFRIRKKDEKATR